MLRSIYPVMQPFRDDLIPFDQWLLRDFSAQDSHNLGATVRPFSHNLWGPCDDSGQAEANMTDFSKLLGQVEDGNPGATNELFRIVDTELRALAARQLRNEPADISLQATELVHEAYMRLVGDQEARSWKSRGYFFGAASEAMRRILVDHARRKRSLKRGGNAEKLELANEFLVVEEKVDEVLAVHDALDELERHNEQAAQLVKLRYFLGLKHHEAAETMQISKRVADRLWLIAKTRLFKTLQQNKS